MDHLMRYRKMLMETLKLSEEELSLMEAQEVGAWDSFSQMNLIAALEETFSISCTLDDMADFVSVKAGMEILRRHNICL